MKSRVKFSTLSIILTVIVIGVLVVALFSSYNNDDKFLVLVIVTAGLLFAGLFYCPVSVEATQDGLTVYRILKAKSFAFDDIASVARCYPSGGGISVCGSGGFMGYWGWFRDSAIGTYFGYYGDRDNCILLRLKSGRQYVLGCTNPDSNRIHPIPFILNIPG